MRVVAESDNIVASRVKTKIAFTAKVSCRKFVPYPLLEGMIQ